MTNRCDMRYRVHVEDFAKLYDLLYNIMIKHHYEKNWTH